MISMPSRSVAASPPSVDRRAAGAGVGLQMPADARRARQDSGDDLVGRVERHEVEVRQRAARLGNMERYGRIDRGAGRLPEDDLGQFRRSCR